jgi:hypothetical protein
LLLKTIVAGQEKEDTSAWAAISTPTWRISPLQHPGQQWSGSPSISSIDSTANRLDVHKETVVACLRQGVKQVRVFATTMAGLIALSEPQSINIRRDNSVRRTVAWTPRPHDSQLELSGRRPIAADNKHGTKSDSRTECEIHRARPLIVHVTGLKSRK